MLCFDVSRRNGGGGGTGSLYQSQVGRCRQCRRDSRDGGEDKATLPLLSWAGPQTQTFPLLSRTMEQDMTWVRCKDGYLNATAIASVAVSLTTTGESCLWSVYAKNCKASIGEGRLCASA